MGHSSGVTLSPGKYWLTGGEPEFSQAFNADFHLWRKDRREESFLRKRVCVCVCVCSAAKVLPHTLRPRTAACHAPLPWNFPKQGNWSGLPLPTPGDLSDPRIKSVSLVSPASAGFLGSPNDQNGGLEPFPTYKFKFIKTGGKTLIGGKIL